MLFQCAFPERSEGEVHRVYQLPVAVSPYLLVAATGREAACLLCLNAGRLWI